MSEPVDRRASTGMHMPQNVQAGNVLWINDKGSLLHWTRSLTVLLAWESLLFGLQGSLLSRASTVNFMGLGDG